MSARRRGEFGIVSELLAPLGGGDARALGFADDAAVLPPKSGVDTAVSTDTMVAGVHFPGDMAAETVARRLLRVSLSDLAAMGARADAYLLNLVLPHDVSDAWLEEFAAGLRIDQEAFAVTLLGGDITATEGPLTVTATVFGEVECGRAVARSGAAPGDAVMVSGTVGDAVFGLRALAGGGGGSEEQIRRFRLPEPRLGLGRNLAGVATAMADVSDGLAADLGHVCAASGVGARVALDRVPLSSATPRDAVAEAVTGGDDYELVFTVAPGDREKALAAGAAAGVAVTEIGVTVAGPGGVALIGADGRPVATGRPGWRHF